MTAATITLTYGWKLSGNRHEAQADHLREGTESELHTETTFPYSSPFVDILIPDTWDTLRRKG